MKKLFILTCAMCIIGGAVNAAENVEQKTGPVQQQVEQQTANPEQMKQARKNRKNDFEQRLKLTETQKLKAQELRKIGHERIKPVMEQIKAKKQEAKMVRLSKMTVQAQEEKLIEIDKELTMLEKKAQQIRKQNMKDFEAILTREQKQILKNMKKEGRRNFEKGQKPHPPLQRAEGK